VDHNSKMTTTAVQR